jgi:hypothetical protein
MELSEALDNLNLDQSQREFFELAARKEDLHPDLVPYLGNSPKVGRVLKHPLVFELFYDPQSNARINKCYLAKREYAEQKFREGNYRGWLWMFERPHRLEKFLEIMDRLPDEEYWKLLGSIWADSENLWQYSGVLGSLLRSGRPGREKMMDEEELAFLKNLPETFTVYRGHQGRRNRLGWSWSLSYFRARWFAERFGQKGAAVVRATVAREDVVAYFSGRGEFEIVADPAAVRGMGAVRMEGKRPPWLQSILDEAWAGFRLSKSSSYHGLWHWQKVERNAGILARRTRGADRTTCRVFALVHDSRRENEDEDPEHGDRAADWVEELYRAGRLPLTESQRDLLTYACRLHERGLVSEDPTVGVCWDADRLDLTRVGIVPDPALLSTEAGKELIWTLP